MAKSISVHQKKRGRPATGRQPAVTVRLPVSLISAIDRWGARNSFSRSEAIRKLLEQVPTLSQENRSTNEHKARKAAEMAARTVESVESQSVPAEEQARRKRALIRGPKEFRDIREDLPKPEKR
jgi:Arc/MetJ-type ribon-helix-helix transcriptional regulator